MSGVAEGETPDGEAVRVQALKSAKGVNFLRPAFRRGADRKCEAIWRGAECAGCRYPEDATNDGAGSAECVEQLVEVVKYNSLGQISHALYEVGGEYRRNM